jgi:hypothetical protein
VARRERARGALDDPDRPVLERGGVGRCGRNRPIADVRRQDRLA